MSIGMSIIIDYSIYYHVPRKYLGNLATYVRVFSEQRIKLNPIIDFDELCFPKLRGLGITDFYVKTSHDGESSSIVLEPHNFPDVCHLDLAESSFVRLKDKDEDGLRVMQPNMYAHKIYSEFLETRERRMVIELIIRIAEIPNSLPRLMKNLLNFVKISRCIKKDEMIPISKACLTAMHRQEEFGSDGSLTVQVLKTLCILPEHKQDLLIHSSCDLLDYVLRCCTAEKFDFETYYIFNKLEEGINFCPVTVSILIQQPNGPKLKLLLEHGLGLQALNLHWMEYECMGAGETYESEAGALGLEDSKLSFSARRRYILLLFLFTVFSSVKSIQQPWAEWDKLLFNSIPDAHVCELEVRSFLKSSEFRENYETFLALCSKFKGSYATSRTPRTLKHASRCAVRKMMRKNFQIPNGIDALFIPDPLKSYLKNLED